MLCWYGLVLLRLAGLMELLDALSGFDIIIPPILVNDGLVLCFSCWLLLAFLLYTGCLVCYKSACAGACEALIF